MSVNRGQTDPEEQDDDSFWRRAKIEWEADSKPTPELEPVDWVELAAEWAEVLEDWEQEDIEWESRDIPWDPTQKGK